MGILSAAKAGAKALEEAFKAEQAAKAFVPVTAAERAAIGKKAAEATAKQVPTKMSEALGKANVEGKKLRVTQTDRTAAKHLGGAPFSMMQEVDPRYADIMATWGVKTPAAAKNIANQSGEDVVWSTLIGSPTQHRSNELIFEKLYKAFQKAAKQGDLSEELRTKFNNALEPLFGEGADILDPKLRKQIDTFKKRAAVGNLLLGEGLGGAQRGGSIIPGAKIMSETTEPMLRDVETFSIGPRLFTLNKGVVTRPDIHPAFPEILQGEDLKQLFVPAPNEIALPTFHEEFKARTGRKRPEYYDLTMTPPGQPYPTQDVTEEYLRHLERHGYAKGGLAHMAGGGPPERRDVSELTPIARNRAGQPVTSGMIPGAIEGLWNTLSGAAKGATQAALGAPGDINELLLEIGSAFPNAPKPYTSKEIGKMLPSAGKSQEAGIGEAAGEFLPLPAVPVGKIAKAVKSGAQAVAPRAGDLASQFINKQAEAMGLPLEMGIVPEGGAKLSKEEYAAMMREKYASQNKPKAAKAEEVKAPANDLGFYSATEKAALNLPRKSGTGDAFISDLLKQPDVSPARLDEMGITDALKGRKDVTRDEVQALVAESKIPLDESVRGSGSPKIDSAGESAREEVFNKYQPQIDAIYKEMDARPYDSDILQPELDDVIKARDAEADAFYKIPDPYPEAKFGPESHPDYNTLGGENYREIRIKVPENNAPIDTSQWKVETFAETPEGRKVRVLDENGNVIEISHKNRMSDEKILRRVAQEESKKRFKDKNFYHSTHHDDEANVLTHLRVADHVDAEGKSGLLVDELQSDWHQQGREKGYKSGDADKAAKDFYQYSQQLANKYDLNPSQNLAMFATMKGIKPEEVAKYEQLQSAWVKTKDGVPDAPFKENWYQLGLKRAIKEAADTGKDRLYLTTGATQNQRYDLSKKVDFIDYRKSSDGSYELGIADKNGDAVDLPKVRYTSEELPSVVGKEIADKIIKGEGQAGGNRMTLRGVDLEVGGEGMKQYYDKTYLNWLKKYAKEHGATVGETKLPGAAKKVGDLSTKERHDLLDNPEFKKTVERNVEEASLKNSNRPTMEVLSEAWDKALEDIFAQKVYYLEITPKMRKSAEKGQAYAKGGAVRMAEGGSVPKAPSNWTDYLSQHAQEESMRLMGGDTALNPMKDGGSVNLDDMIRNAVEKANARNYASGGAVNIDDLIQRAVTLRNQHA